MSMIQKECEACGQVMTITNPPKHEVRYCYTCTEEFEDTLDAPRLTNAELDDWAKRTGAETWDVYQYDN